MNNADVLFSTHRLEQIMKDWVSKPIIKATLVRSSGPGWILALTEEWPDKLAPPSSMLLDKCVDWTTEKLKDNEACTRLSWYMWQFKSKKDADKFLTMFYLVWTK